MTTPPFDREPTGPDTAVAPTEPVPAFYPPTEPSHPAAFVPPPPSDPLPMPAPVRAQPTKGGSRSSRALNILLGAAVLVAAVGVAFALGRTTAPASAASVTGGSGQGTGRLFTNGSGPGGSFDPNRGTFQFGNGNGRGLAGAPTIQGTVDSITADSVTIKTANGNTITVGLDSNTTYHQQAPAAASDVTAGETVILQLSGGFRPGNGNGNPNASANPSDGNGNGTGAITLGTAGDVTVVP